MCSLYIYGVWAQSPGPYYRMCSLTIECVLSIYTAFGRSHPVLLYPAGGMVSDVQQGALGDCYLLGALSVVACRPDLLDQIFGHFKLVDSTVTHASLMSKGLFTVQMYKDCSWHDVTVDTRIPCRSRPPRRDEDFAAEPAPLQPCFGRCVQEHQMWVAVLEKAYAKLHGSFAAIARGNMAEALADLTGVCVCVCVCVCCVLCVCVLCVCVCDTHTFFSICIHIHTFVHVYIQACCMYACMHACIHTCIHTYTHA